MKVFVSTFWNEVKNFKIEYDEEHKCFPYVNCESLIDLCNLLEEIYGNLDPESYRSIVTIRAWEGEDNSRGICLYRGDHAENFANIILKLQEMLDEKEN